MNRPAHLVFRKQSDDAEVRLGGEAHRLDPLGQIRCELTTTGFRSERVGCRNSVVMPRRVLFVNEPAEQVATVDVERLQRCVLRRLSGCESPPERGFAS